MNLHRDLLFAALAAAVLFIIALQRLTVDTRSEPFLPVAPRPAGRNVYPWGIERSALEQVGSDDTEEASDA